MSLCFASQWWPIYTILLLNVNKCKIKPDRSLLKRLKAQHYIDTFVKIEYFVCYVSISPQNRWKCEIFEMSLSTFSFQWEKICAKSDGNSVQKDSTNFTVFTQSNCVYVENDANMSRETRQALCVYVCTIHIQSTSHNMCCATRARYLMKWNYLFMHHYIFNHIAHWIQLNIHVIHLATVVIFSILS